MLAETLVKYDIIQHVASDIPVDHLYLPPEKIEMQNHLNDITKWTEENFMLLNEEKSKYIIFTRSKQEFSTRLLMNDTPLERIKVFKMLGIWLQEDLGWEKNTREVCKKAFSRVSVQSKLKYAGISTEDLIVIYTLFIRSLTEYCSVAFHSALTENQSHKLEAIQSTCLKVILGDNYVSYNAALEMTGLERLQRRRERRQLSFALKCLKTEFTSKMFPKNNEHKKKETFVVNFARTEQYRRSAVIQCQNTLNAHFKDKSKQK